MKYLFLVLFSAFLAGCSSVQIQGTLAIDPVKNFDLTGFNASVDESVGCPGIHPVVDDIYIDKHSNLLVVTSNIHNTPGLYMNAIASKPLEFVYNSIYTVMGEWRVPEEAENQQIDINLQLVESDIESHAEILWDHGETNLNGWIWTRFQDLTFPVKLFHIGIDRSWHSFQLVVKYQSNPRRRIIERIRIDDFLTVLNKDMGTLNKGKGWGSSFMLLLETTNKYTNCSTDYNFVGKSFWRNVSVQRADIPQE